jgi:tRNA pseudouridine13 synthase
LSAARSWIFNQVLSARVRAGNWNQYVSGDVLMLDGRSACFADDGSADLAERVTVQALHPTGPLWGRGESMARGEVLQLEQSVAAHYADFCRGLEKAGMDQERRALRLRVSDLQWQLEGDVLRVVFNLPAGSYATMVLREIIG